MFRRHRPDAHLGTDHDIDLEVTHHLERTIADLEADGMTRAQAVAEARRRFGNVDRYRRKLRTIGRRPGRIAGAGVMELVAQTIRQATRSIVSRPGFACTVILTLALGIGANATMFSVVDRLLLEPPHHVAAPEQVKRIYIERLAGTRQAVLQLFTYPDMADWSELDALTGLAGYGSTFAMVHTRVDGVGDARVTMTAGDFFGVLGTRPHLGQLYGDAGPGDRVAVLDHGFWRREYGGDPAAVGQTIGIGRYVYRIIGVAPRGFTGMELTPTDVWLPARAAGEDVTGGPWDWENSRGMYWLKPFVRLRAGTSPEAVAEQMTALHRGARAQMGSYDQNAAILVAPIVAARGPDPDGDVRVAAWLSGVALVVLLISCANVANLQYSRSMTRRREIGIRLALGVGRPRLGGQLVLESVLLAVAAGGAALALAHWGGAVMRSVLLPDLAWSAPDTRLLWFTLGTSVLVGALAGVLPAIHATRTDIIKALRTGVRQAGDGRTRTRGALVIAQVTLSTMLLIGAGAFVTSLRRVHAIDLGFDVERLHVVQLNLDAAGGTPLPTRWWHDAARRISQLPQIDGATYTSIIPFWSSYTAAFVVPGRDSLPKLETGGPHAHAVGPRFFRVAGTRIIQGRDWADNDMDAGSPADRVMVVGRTLAELAWPDESPLGQCVRVGSQAAPCTTVIGVAEDVRAISVLEGQNASYYLPHGVIPDWEPRALLIRTSPGSVAPWGTLRRTLEALVPSHTLITIQPLGDFMAPQVRHWKLGANMFTAFGALALIVAGVGLYSVLLFNVEYRRHELGVRSALGATVGRLARLVVGEGVGMIAFGFVTGTALALATGRWIQSLLYQTTPAEPGILVRVGIILGIAALVATVIPALRAARIDPNTMLRSE